MKKLLRSAMRPERSRGLVFTMAFFLMLSSLLAPVMPMVDAATISNVTSAQEAAAFQDDGGDVPPPDEGGDVPPPDEGGEVPPPDDGGEVRPPDDGGDVPPPDDGGDVPPPDEGDDVPPPDDGGEVPPPDENEELPPPDSPAHWRIELLWCPPGVDMASISASQCYRQGPDVQVTITPQLGGPPQLQQTIRDFNQYVGFNEMPGDWLLDIQTVPNINERFDCVGRTPSGNTKPYASYARSSGGYQMSTVSDEHLECTWFGQMQNTSILEAVKFNCPAGFDFASSSASSARAACTERVTGPVGFEVASTDNLNYVNYKQTQPSTGNTAIFNDVPGGTMRVAEEVPDGYILAGAYCSLTDWRGSSGAQQPVAQTIFEDSHYGFHWEYTSTPFTLMKCDVYNVGQGSGNINVLKSTCDAIPAEGADIQWYRDNCYMAVPDLEITLTNGNADDTHVGQTANTGLMTAHDLPAGEWTITEAGMEGYYLDVAFCEYAQGPEYQTITPNGNSIVVNLQAGRTLTCALNNVPMDHVMDRQQDEELEEYGTLYITKMLCPEDVVASNHSDYASMCEEPMEGVGFNFSRGNGAGDFYPTDTQGMLIRELGPGSWTVSEQIDQNYALAAVFCMPPEEGDNTWIPQQISGNSFSLEIVADATHNCLLFNKPYDAADEVDDEFPVRVGILKYKCDSNILPAGMDEYAWYTENCTTYQSDITFGMSVYLGGPVGAGMTDSNGYALLYEGAPLSGEYIINERDLPEGYTAMTAFCRDVAFEGQTSDWVQYDISNNGILVDFAGNNGLECLWYNLAPPDRVTQQDDLSTLTVHKYECPEMLPAGERDAGTWYSANCQMTMDGVTFTLTSPNLNPGQERTTGPDPAGYAEWTDLPNGEYTLTESMYTGYTPLAALCSQVKIGEEGTNSVLVQFGQSEDRAMLIGIDADYEHHCEWFNLQQEDEEYDLTLHKFECPEGTTYGEMYSYYSENCVTPQAGVPFTMTDDSGTAQLESGMESVRIEGLVGDVTLTESIPTGYGDPVVYCGELSNGVATSPSSVTNGSVTLPASEYGYQCFWYNIPLDDYSLTLYKWQCPEGTMYGEMHSYYSAECDMEHIGVPFQFTDNRGTQDFMSDAHGYQIDGLSGQIILREMGLPGYGDPVVYCQLLNDEDLTLYTSTNGIVMLPPAMGDDYQCFWYNIPVPDSTVTVYKWRCPDGMPAEYTQSWFEMNCGTPMEVDFTLTDNKGLRTLTSTGGMVQWSDVATGAVQLTEHIPMGYTMQPYLVCDVTDPAGMTSDPFYPTTVNGTWNTTTTAAGSTIHCDWYNWYLGEGEITVHKRLCPEGYNRHAWNADPMMDCTETVNGIPFMLDQPDPGVDLFSDTGDSIDSAVYFGGLVPGDYTLTEMVGAGDYQDIFVWQCYGLNMSSVHPTPLSVGQSLDIKIVGGDDIECYWFNVPYPQYGYMVVSKYNCSTEKYVSDVYCYTNQMGQYFDLQMFNGNTWTTVQSGTTDVSGKITFDMLNPGEYRLNEPNKQACLMKSSNITGSRYIGVNEGQGTTVYVYNCKTPPPPQKTPTKYPKTGVPVATEGDVVRTPGVELAGLAGLLGLATNRRRMVAGAGLVTAGAVATALPLLNAQELLPLDSTPAPGTPAPDVFWCATPTAGTPEAEGTPVVDPCNRGAIPIHMRIPIIEVDAPMEYLEIIDGVMEQPTGDTHITWYKETSRLGEVGNGIYAAHVNWYGNPEGIFFRLESLQQGDVIEIDGDNQQTLLYEVQWMQDFPSDEEPPEEALGLTDEVVITLITCGGEWSSAISEYDHRTLVRAVLRE